MEGLYFLLQFSLLAAVFTLIKQYKIRDQLPDERDLAGRIQSVLSRFHGITKRKMFGGVCFFANGNMIGGPTSHGQLVIRVGHDMYLECLKHEHISEMDFTGKPMKGFVYISPEGILTDQQLKEWLTRGICYARSLPAR